MHVFQPTMDRPMTHKHLIKKRLCRVLLTLYIFFFLGNQFISAQNKSLETTGDVLFVAIPALAYGTTFLKNDKKGSRQFEKSFLVNIAMTAGLKILIEKQRPNMENGNSFPSGHSSVTFQGASFFQRRYGWKFGVPAYLLAGFTGYTRINADKHDLTDVIAGAVIGIGSTYLFTTPYQKEHMELSFSTLDNTYLIGFRFKF